MTIPAKLIDTTQEHLERLIADEVQEGPHIDFKRDLPANWDNAAKSEFLADVSAFANAGGGDVVYGVDEDGAGQASSLVPQVVGNINAAVLRMQDLLLHQVEPRIPGVQVFPVPVTVAGTAGHAIIIRAPQSWAGPHRVRLSQHFYVREGRRKRQLDVPEIRGLFLRSESQGQRVRDFRTERLGRILSGEAFYRLVEGPLLVAHLVPVQSMVGLVQIDPVTYAQQRHVPLIGATAGWARINIDGALAIRNPDAGGTHGYSQLFRNGALEATKVYPRRPGEQFANLPSTAYEQHIIELLRSFRAELVHHGIEAGCTVMLSLLQADKFKLGVRQGLEFFDERQTLFDRSTVLVPDILADAAQSPEHALKPAFDLLWQAAGFERSRNFDAAGNWAPPA